MKKNIPYLLFLLYSLIIFWPIIIGQGVPAGGDWSLPYGTNQVNVHFQFFSNAWNELSSNGSRNLALCFYPVVLFTKLIFSFGISSTMYSKYVLLIIFTLAGSSLYSLLKYLKLNSIAAFAGGLIYITSPLFFNYSIMGWVYILFFISALLPLATKHFLISQNEKSVRHLVITTIIFAVASIQAQSVILFPLVFFAIGLVNSKNTSDIKYLFKSFLIMMAIFFLLTSYWLPGMLLIPDQGVAGSDIVNSSVSTGTAENLNPSNTIRLFGGLFNFQYETIINQSVILKISSFILPLIAIGSLLIKKNTRLSLSFWIIGLFPFMMYYLNQNRQLFSLIPYANVFRDFSRFTVLSSFAYAILAGIFLNALIINHRKISKFLFGAIIVFLFISTYPWWHGELTAWQSGKGPDMRLRLYDVNPDYTSVEIYLTKVNPYYKALYLPTGGYISYPGNEKFFGPYKEMQDMFSQFSPISGSLVLNDRNVGDYFINKLKSNLSGDIVSVLGPANYKYIILRKDTSFADKEKISQNLRNIAKKGNIKVALENTSITVYELVNPSPLIYSSGSSKIQKINFVKNNPSSYSVNIVSSKQPFNIIFNEHFHQQWKVYSKSKNVLDYFIRKPVIDELNHLQANGFSNSWQIYPEELCKNNDICTKNTDDSYQINLEIEFFPERILQIGLIISTISLISCLILIFNNKSNEK